MQWWAWIAVGAILLGSELAFVDAQFYLVFVGTSAFVVGMLLLAGLGLAAWLQWLIFAALAAICMLTFRRRIYERMRRGLPAMKGGPAGEIVTLPEALPPGETCRLEYRGSSWSAVNAGKAVIAAGARARIERVQGLTLVVRGEVHDGQ
ncbi:MAG: inner membrane protein [Gammaproteobacteria bacterium]|jgi:membrane protein implicated in regulation of membrane protease activity|nr:inner membrane protein [Gammaproteobacteria bacterium]